MAGLDAIRAEAARRIAALGADAVHLRQTPRFVESTRAPIEELAGRSRVFEAHLEIDRRDDLLSSGPYRWRASGVIRVRYEAGGPSQRRGARAAAAYDAQRIIAELDRPNGWPAANNVHVRTVGAGTEDYIGGTGNAVAVILAVQFTALFFEEDSP